MRLIAIPIFLRCLESMVVSLDPRYQSDIHSRGQRFTNYAIGEMLIAELALSIEKYKDVFKTMEAPAEAARRLVKAARKKAARTGKTVGEVLEEHQEVVEDRYEYGRRNRKRFIDQGKYAADRIQSNDDVYREMQRQDVRRAEHTFTPITAAAARQVDAIEASRHIIPVPEGGFPGGQMSLPPPTSSVIRPPAKLDAMGGQTPNADRLLLTEGSARRNDPIVLYSSPHRRNAPLRLRHNPSGGGGFHNPHIL